MLETPEVQQPYLDQCHDCGRLVVIDEYNEESTEDIAEEGTYAAMGIFTQGRLPFSFALLLFLMLAFSLFEICPGKGVIATQMNPQDVKTKEVGADHSVIFCRSLENTL